MHTKFLCHIVHQILLMMRLKLFFVLFYFFNHGMIVFVCLFIFLPPILNCATCVYHVFTFIIYSHIHFYSFSMNWILACKLLKFLLS